MATEVFKVEIAGQEKVINSAKELKAAIKAAQDEVIKGTPGAEKALAQLKDKMDDVKDATQSVRGEGLEPLKGSLGLLKDGFANLDFDKIGMAFKGLGTAMKAVPVFLMVEAITYLVTNFKELTEGTGILAKVLRPIGDIVDWLIDGFYQLTDALGFTNSALDKMGEAAVDNAAKAKEALSSQTAEFERQMKVARAAGESTIGLEKAKQQAIIDTNVQIVKQIEAFVRAGGVLDEEKKKLLTASLEAIKNAKTEEKVIDLNHQKELKDNYQKHLDELAKKDQIALEERKKVEKELDDYRRQIRKDWEAEQDAVREKFKKSKFEDKEEVKMFDDEVYANWSATQSKKNKKTADSAAKEKEIMSQSFAVAKASIDSQAQLVNFLFDLKRSRLQKGSAEEVAAAKKQFQINKGLAIANSVMSGIQGVINALSANSVIPEPYRTILNVANAVAVGIAATVNTAKIASTKFDAGGAGGGGGDASASVGSSATAAPPVPQINTPQNTPSTTTFDEDGKNTSIKVKAEVVETESTSTQKRVARLEDQASF